jgi:hypothetical protein
MTDPLKSTTQTIFSPKTKGFRAIALLIALFYSSGTSAQSDYPQDYFISPMDIPLQLSGSFGELRTNHFHAGLDIKTQQKEGQVIRSVADGYVSRIKISPVGYGYALYITHPNGYTSVYGHLKKYAPAIDAYAKTKQYEQQLFGIDLYLQPNELPVTQGELVAYSGNSGSSGGPHLHFEIRETLSEKVVNPLLFGFKVKDKIPPLVNSIWIVPMNDSAWVNASQIPVAYETKGSSGAVGLKNPKPAIVYGDIAFAVHTTDMLDGNTNRCGIYSIELFVDSVQVYGQRMDKLDFTTNRAMNAHTIYERFKKNKSSIHGSYRLPGNPLDIYENLVNDGILSFRDNKIHQCEYVLMDIMGNKSSVKFKVQSTVKHGVSPKPKSDVLAHWNWEEDNSYVGNEVKISMGAYTLYEDLDLTIKKTAKREGAASPNYLIASTYEPVHNAYFIELKADHLKPNVRDKAVVVRYDPDKNKLTSEGGEYNEGWVCTETMYLGNFMLMVDTVKPAIASIDFAASLKGRTQFSFRVSDGLSGIDQIIPKIDGKWILMEYDAKSSRITYYFDSAYIEHGKHTFELTVIDGRKNSRTYTGVFDW